MAHLKRDLIKQCREEKVIKLTRFILRRIMVWNLGKELKEWSTAMGVNPCYTAQKGQDELDHLLGGSS